MLELTSLALKDLEEDDLFYYYYFFVVGWQGEEYHGW
jgi:hypothetical protein